MQRNRKQAKKTKNYEKNKRAFDKVFARYRALLTTSVSATNIETAGGKPKNKPVKLRPLDYKCDVDRAVKIVVPPNRRTKFYAVYGITWTDDEIELGVVADKVLGGVHHSWEQRLGELFIRLGLYKTRQRGKGDKAQN
jgi:hypothetical protein